MCNDPAHPHTSEKGARLFTGNVFVNAAYGPSLVVLAAAFASEGSPRATAIAAAKRSPHESEAVLTARTMRVPAVRPPAGYFHAPRLVLAFTRAISRCLSNSNDRLQMIEKETRQT